jgi:hypothetical protein
MSGFDMEVDEEWVKPCLHW